MYSWAKTGQTVLFLDAKLQNLNKGDGIYAYLCGDEEI